MHINRYENIDFDNSAAQFLLSIGELLCLLTPVSGVINTCTDTNVEKY